MEKSKGCTQGEKGGRTPSLIRITKKEKGPGRIGNLHMPTAKEKESRMGGMVRKEEKKNSTAREFLIGLPFSSKGKRETCFGLSDPPLNSPQLQKEKSSRRMREKGIGKKKNKRGPVVRRLFV